MIIEGLSILKKKQEWQESKEESQKKRSWQSHHLSNVSKVCSGDMI
jgi:hypothetical protein